MNDLTPPPKPYEVYPGCLPQDFGQEFLTRNPIKLQAFCKNEHIDPRELPRLVGEILTEWELTEPPHMSRHDAVSHLINHLRIKTRHEQRNTTAQTSDTPGRGQLGNPTALDLAREILGQSSD